MILEAFQYVETKHVQDVRNFHVLKSIRANAAGANAALVLPAANLAPVLPGAGVPPPQRRGQGIHLGLLPRPDALGACCYRSGSADAARSRATDPATTRAEPAAIRGLRRCAARATRRA